MMKLLLIALFGAAGAVSRYLASGFAIRWFGESFPAGTLIVNVAGCFLIGVLYHLGQAGTLINDEWRAGLRVGFLGGLTTFSTFGYETFERLEAGLWRAAGINIFLNVLLGLAAVWLGVILAKLLFSGA
jgi:CrcB protein